MVRAKLSLLAFPSSFLPCKRPQSVTDHEDDDDEDDYKTRRIRTTS
jgi:hypothetical protein